MDNLIESIKARAEELAQIEQEMRDLATRKAIILESLRAAGARIEEIVKNGMTKSAATAISSIEGLDSHTRNCLKAENIHFLEDLVNMTEAAVSRLPHLGGNGVAQIRIAMQTHGLSFAT